MFADHMRETEILHRGLSGTFPDGAIAVGANDGGDHPMVRPEVDIPRRDQPAP
jgi:hypothetical protein